MAAPPDPYRTLGLGRDATTEEIRRAYRRLAKANHPDSAGEAALPRFLAIQAAYEALVGPSRGRRPGARPTAGRAPQPPREPWRADPERARATREASERRSGRRPGARPFADESAGRGADREAGGAGAADHADGTGSDAATPPGSRRRGERRRSPKKATLGSTSYDAADDEPFEPDWSGGTWYGASSGTYWTINPKEYADPRKHGPEYQRRAKRRLDAAPGVDGEPVEDPEAREAGDGEGDGPARGATDVSARSGTASAEASSAGTGLPVPPLAGVEGPQAGDLESAGLFDGFGGRIALALVGWPPIGLAFATLVGEMTGCGRFAASCVAPLGVGTWLAQLAIIAILLALPGVAAVASVGTLAALAAAVPTAVVLSATGGAYEPVASATVLAVVLGAAWLGGVAFALVRHRRPRLP